MFVVDTNVISETMRAEPHVSVITWLDARPARDLFVTAVTEAEIRTGVAMLPESRRRRNLAEAAERVFGKMFAGRVLPFDGAAARAYAKIDGAVKSRFLMRVGWVIIVYVYFTRPTDRGIV